MAKKRIVVVGAGLAGLSAAWHLQKSRIDCVLLEKEAQVGGLCRSKKLNGFVFDYSGHLLHFKRKATFEFVKRLLGDNLQEHKRSAWVYSHDTFTPYPFQAHFYGLPAAIVKDCLLGFLVRRKTSPVSKGRQLTFLEWIQSTFGSGISRHFMVPYNSKFWTVHPRQMTCGWLEGFIPTPSLEEMIEGAIEDSGKLLGYNSHFWYPRHGGIGQLPEALRSQLVSVLTSSEVCSIDARRKEITLKDGRRMQFDFLISTIPLPEMKGLLKGSGSKCMQALRALRWNSVFNVNLGVEKLDVDHRHWVYFPQKDICFYRVGFPYNFSPARPLSVHHSLYVEVSYDQHKPLDKSAIVKRIRRDLQRVGILKYRHKIYAQDINDIAYGYPIYDKRYAQAREVIIKDCIYHDIIPCGRYGSWKYISMEDALFDGYRAAVYVREHL